MSITRRQVALTFAAALSGFAADDKSGNKERVQLLRVPKGGLQPQTTIDEKGTLHLIYFQGEARNGDVFYVKSHDRGATFSNAIRVNSQPGSAIASGTIRGAQLAVGSGGRVHVAWNGSSQADPKGPVNPDSGKPGEPFLYSRLNDKGTAFEAQRNLMHNSFGLDGGGTIAADPAGNVFVAWHGIASTESKVGEGEARRRVWISKSSNSGQTFSAEAAAWSKATGACGCCGMKMYAGRRGDLSILYRSATQSIHRDIYLLKSTDRGQSFQGSLMHKWELNACPMTSMDIVDSANDTLYAWETAGQVYWSRGSATPIAAPGEAKARKHPRLAVNDAGEVLMAWTEGTSFQKGGALAWQVYDAAGKPSALHGQMPGIPANSFAAVISAGDRFSIIY